MISKPAGHLFQIVLMGVRGMMATGQVMAIQATSAYIRMEIGEMFARALLSPLIEGASMAMTSSGTTSIGNPGVAALLTGLAGQCRISKGKCFLRKIPTLVNGFNHPNVTLHIWEAEMGMGSTADGVPRPMPFLLIKGPTDERRQVTKSIRDASAACKGKSESFDCDEYPYASTLNGGDILYYNGLVSLKAVPRGDNRSQGGKLGAFYKSQGIRNGSLFLNLAIPFVPTFTIDRQGKAK